MTKKKDLHRKINGFSLQMRIGTKQSEKRRAELWFHTIMWCHPKMVTPGASRLPLATPLGLYLYNTFFDYSLLLCSRIFLFQARCHGRHFGAIPPLSLLVPLKRGLCPKRTYQARCHWSAFRGLCPSKILLCPSIVIVITFYSPSYLGPETVKGPFGLPVKLPPAHLFATHGGGFALSFLMLNIKQESCEYQFL